MLIEAIINNFEEVSIFAIFLGILIAVHEWGHFITAKKLGIQVDEFAIGFGPTLVKKFYNGTTYMLKLFPLGGYVRMAGDERDKCTGDPKEFYSKPVGNRALVVFNGPLINFALAYLCLVFVYMIGHENLAPRINWLETGMPAQQAGLQKGDEIIEINNERVFYMKEVLDNIQNSEGENLSVKIKRDGQEMNFVVPVVTKHEKNMYGRMDDLRFIGLDTLPNVIGGFPQDSPAQEAGLEVGDTIIEIDSQPIAGWMDIQKAVESAQNDTIQVKILRDGQVISKEITPKIIGEGDQNRRLIGIGPEQDLKALDDPDFAKVKHRFGPIEAVKRGTEDFLEISGMTYNAIYSMLTGTMSAKDNIGGPVLIYNIVVDAKEEGFSYFLFILGVISLNLAIFNLLPIIPLDGGHLFMMAIEKIKGSPLPAKVENVIGNVGFSLIILLALYVFYIDFARIGLIDSIKNLPSKISQSVSQ